MVTPKRLLPGDSTVSVSFGFVCSLQGSAQSSAPILAPYHGAGPHVAGGISRV